MYGVAKLFACCVTILFPCISISCSDFPNKSIPDKTYPEFNNMSWFLGLALTPITFVKFAGYVTKKLLFCAATIIWPDSASLLTHLRKHISSRKKDVPKLKFTILIPIFSIQFNATISLSALHLLLWSSISTLIILTFAFTNWLKIFTHIVPCVILSPLFIFEHTITLSSSTIYKSTFSKSESRFIFNPSSRNATFTSPIVRSPI